MFGQTQSIADRVGKEIADVMDRDSSSITPKMNLRDDLNADSLDHVEIIMCLEDEFELSISDEDAEKLLTVNDMIEYVRRRVSA